MEAPEQLMRIVVIASSTRGFVTLRAAAPPVINLCPSTQDQDEKGSFSLRGQEQCAPSPVDRQRKRSMAPAWCAGSGPDLAGISIGSAPPPRRRAGRVTGVQARSLACRPGHWVVVCLGRIATAMRYALSGGGPWGSPYR